MPHYPVLLLLNVVLFGFFQEATGTAVGSIVGQESVVRKTQFPRLVIPLAVVLTTLFNLGLNLGDDVTYSGTISAAFEGALLHIPSIAFSALVPASARLKAFLPAR